MVNQRTIMQAILGAALLSLPALADTGAQALGRTMAKGVYAQAIDETPYNLVVGDAGAATVELFTGGQGLGRVQYSFQGTAVVLEKPSGLMLVQFAEGQAVTGTILVGPDGKRVKDLEHKPVMDLYKTADQKLLVVTSFTFRKEDASFGSEIQVFDGAGNVVFSGSHFGSDPLTFKNGKTSYSIKLKEPRM